MNLEKHCTDHWYKAAAIYRMQLDTVLRKAELIFKGNRVDARDIQIFIEFIETFKPQPLPLYEGPEDRLTLGQQWEEVKTKEPRYAEMLSEAKAKIKSYQNMGL